MRRVRDWVWLGTVGLWLVGALAPLQGGEQAPATQAGAEFPDELVKFASGGAPPLFEKAAPGQWDARIRERGWILREGDQWYLWYTGYDGTRAGLKMLGLATSRDGLTWTRHPGNPIYRQHWVEDMMVVPHAGTYYMFCEGLNDEAQLLTSTDKVHWKRAGRLDIRTTAGTPLAAGPYGTPVAWHEHETWYLFYERQDRGVWLATSRDLKTWTNVQDDPVLTCGPTAYDRAQIAMNQVIKHQGRYYAYFHGNATGMPGQPWTTNVASSPDLVHWHKYPGNPLLPEGQNESSGIVVHDGQRFRLYTMHDVVRVHGPAGKE